MGEGVHTIQQKTDRSYQRDTDKGLNAREAYTINRLENKIRNRKTEKGYIIGEDGRVIGESRKSGRQSAQFNPWDLKKDSILIHNHPYVGNKGRQLYGTMAGRIGTPFSDTDLITAITSDLKEVRAVTPTYTWSMRRPKGGWGDRQAIMRELSNYRTEFVRRSNEYSGKRYKEADSWRRVTEVSDRANVGIQYSMMKELAKKFGWEFTRRKSN